MPRSRKLPLLVPFVVLALALVACGTPPTTPAPPPPPEPLKACTDPAEEVTFPDADLRSFIRLRLGLEDGQPILCGALDVVTQLNLRDNRDVRSLEGVEHLRNLDYVSFDSQNSLPDGEFTRLGTLPTITSLSVNESKLLRSATFVRNLPDLELLMLDGTGLASLEGVEGLSRLRTLYLRGNPDLKSVAPLTGLPSLVSLQLTGTGVSSLAAVTGSPALKYLRTTNNALTAVDVSDLPSLEEFQLTGNRIGSLPAFSGLGFPKLRVLSVANNELTTLQGLEGMTLTYLAASGNKLETIHHIADLSGVSTLNLEDNLLSDITPLRTVSWGLSPRRVNLAQNCLGVLYYPESGITTMPEGPNNDTWGQLMFEDDVSVNLLPVVTDGRCAR